MKFGPALIQIRKDKSISREALALHLEISTIYLRDIETSRRKPLRPDKILQAAAFLEADPMALLMEAGRDRGAFELPQTGGFRDQLAAELSLSWSKLHPDLMEEIANRVQRDPACLVLKGRPVR